jgi:cation:H+ antiporter
VVGLTVVAFGTSAPELAVSVTACLTDRDALAIGNVVGSNIANLLLVFGLAALIRPMTISRNVVRFDGPVMALTSVLFVALVVVSWLALGEPLITRWQGLLLAGMLVAYIWWTYRYAGHPPDVDEVDAAPVKRDAMSRFRYVVMLIAGLIGLKYGADFIVEGAVGIAETFGISQRVIGLTIVAIGTSLPEIATSLVAARRNQPDIAVGNVVGSNIFNILSVIGISGLVAAPIAVEQSSLYWDLPVMLLATFIALPLMWSGHRLNRLEGGILLLLFGGYLLRTTLMP